MDDRAEPAAKPDPNGPPPGWPAAVQHLRERLADMLLVCDAVLYRASPPAGLLEALRGDTWRLEQALRQCRQALPTGREGRTSDPGAEDTSADCPCGGGGSGGACAPGPQHMGERDERNGTAVP